MLAAPGAEHSAYPSAAFPPCAQRFTQWLRPMTEWPVASSRWRARDRSDPESRPRTSSRRCAVEGPRLGVSTPWTPAGAASPRACVLGSLSGLPRCEHARGPQPLGREGRRGAGS